MSDGVTRRQILKRGIFGGILLFLGGGALVGLRRTRRRRVSAPLQALDSVEYAILAAVADRIVRVEPSVPTPSGLDVALRADGVLALADRGVQKDFRRLLRLFDNGLMGMATLTAVSPFTACSPAAQDSRLAAWEHSRMPLFRTGYQAMKRLCAACYYAAPEAWPSIGYPGPPDVL